MSLDYTVGEFDKSIFEQLVPPKKVSISSISWAGVLWPVPNGEPSAMSPVFLFQIPERVISST